MRLSNPCAIRRRIVIAVFFSGLCLSMHLSAQIVDCAGISGVGGAKVLLDDINSQFDTQMAAEKIRFEIASGLQAFKLQGLAAPQVIRCPGRRPRGLADFPRDLIDALHSRDVVLELWASLLGPKKGKGGCSAIISYALISVQAQSPGAGIYEFEASTLEELGNSGLIDIFESQADNLRGIAALGLGVRELESGNYNRARTMLCKAQLLLSRGKADRSVLVLASELGNNVLTRARSDKQYRGVLKLPSIGECNEH